MSVIFLLTCNTFEKIVYNYYIYKMCLLNLFKNHDVQYMFRPSFVMIRCLKTVLWRLLCLRVFPSDVGCVAHYTFVDLLLFCRVVCLDHEFLRHYVLCGR
jgi:hypothetical protein